VVAGLLLAATSWRGGRTTGGTIALGAVCGAMGAAAAAALRMVTGDAPAGLPLDAAAAIVCGAVAAPRAVRLLLQEPAQRDGASAAASHQ
jgi:hypothetical protein